MPIELSKEDREEAVEALRAYSRAEWDEPLGQLAAGALLDFVLAELGPAVYNRALRDAQERLQARVAELDVELGRPEFPLSRRR